MKYLWKVFWLKKEYKTLLGFDDIGNIVVNSSANFDLHFLPFYYDDDKKEFYVMEVRKNYIELDDDCEIYFPHSKKYGETDEEYVFPNPTQKKILRNKKHRKTTKKTKKEKELNYYVNYGKILVISENDFNELIDCKNINNFSINSSNYTFYGILLNLRSKFLSKNLNLAILKIFITKTKKTIGTKSLYLSNTKLLEYLILNHNRLFGYGKLYSDDKTLKKYDIDSEVNKNSNKNTDKPKNTILVCIPDEYEFLKPESDLEDYYRNYQKPWLKIDGKDWNTLVWESWDNFLRIMRLFSDNDYSFGKLNGRYLRVVRMGIKFFKEYYPYDVKNFWVFQKDKLKGMERKKFANELDRIKNFVK